MLSYSFSWYTFYDHPLISNKKRFIYGNVLFHSPNHRISHVFVYTNDTTSTEVDP